MSATVATMTGSSEATNSKGIRSLFDDEDSQWILRFDSMLKFASNQLGDVGVGGGSGGVVQGGSVPASPAANRRAREKKNSLPNPTPTSGLPRAIPRPSGPYDQVDRMIPRSHSHRATSAPPIKRNAIPRPASANAGLIAPAKISLTAGSVDEQVFLQSFEQVPRVSITSSRDVDQHMAFFRTTLGNGDIDWEKRVACLKQVRSVMVAGGCEYEEFIQALRLLEIPFQTSVRDLRSQVVREACITIAYLCTELGKRLERFLEILLPSLIQLLGSSAKIMSSSGVTCIHFVIQYVHSPRLIPVITKNLSSKNRDIRRYCCEFLHQLLHIWPSSSLERHIVTIQDAIKRGISDPDAEARVQARKAFWGFADHFAVHADKLLLSLDASKQRMLHGANGHPMSQSMTSGSLSRSTLGLHSPSMESLRSPLGASSIPSYATTGRASKPTISGGSSRRSNSAIDFGAARSARLRHSVSNSSAAPSFGFNQSLSRSASKKRLDSATSALTSPERTIRTRGRPVSQSQPNSRSASPSSRLSYATYNLLEGGRVRRSGIPTPTSCRSRDTSPTRSVSSTSYMEQRRGSLGRPASSFARRNEAPPTTERLLRNNRDAEERINHALARTTQPFASPLTSRAAFVASASNDSEGSSSICSDISRHEDISDILANLASVHWSDRKEGLLGLQQVLRSHLRSLSDCELQRVTSTLTKMFMDPHTKVFSLFLDTLNELILAQSVDLHRIGFLPVLLTKLFVKSGTDILTSVLGKIQATLTLIRDTFPHQDQFTVITRFFNDPAHSSSPSKVKVTVLRYLQSLTRVMDSSEVPSNDPNMRDTLHRVIAWASDTKSSELQQVSKAVIGSLYRVKASYFSILINQMAPEYQRIALDVIQNELRTPNAPSTRGGCDSVPLSPLTVPRRTRTLSSSSMSSTPQRSFDSDENLENVKNEHNLRLVLAAADQITRSFHSPKVHSPKYEDLPMTAFSLYAASPSSMGSPNDRLSHCVSILSSPLNSSEQKKTALTELHVLIKDCSLWESEHNFRSTLKILIDNTEDGSPIRGQALNALSELVKKQPHHFANYADLTVVKVLQSQMDKDKDVQKMSDVAMQSVLEAATIQQTSGILAKFVSGCTECSIICAAIKMLSKLLDLHSSESIRSVLDQVAPSLLKAYNHDESSVRKAAVFCMVNLHHKVGRDSMLPYLSTLYGCKLRLLNLYIERAAQQQCATAALNGGSTGTAGDTSPSTCSNASNI